MLEFKVSLWPWETNMSMLATMHELKQHLVQGIIKKDELKVSLWPWETNIVMLAILQELEQHVV